MAKSSRNEAPPGAAGSSRWAGQRPALERAIFAVALLGVLVVGDLWITAQFGQGCLSRLGALFASAEAASTCGFALESDLSAFLGVDNTVWGLLFYLGVAVLTGLVGLGAGAAVRWKRWRAGLVAFGAGYSAVLTIYQFAVLPARCVPCLISAVLVATLAALVAYQYFGAMDGRRRAPARPAAARAYFGGLAALALLLLGVDLGVGIASAEAAGEAVVAAQVVADAAPPAACRFDPDKAAVEDFAALVGPEDPFLGDAEAAVTVVEFFDPNCPHCRSMHPVMKNVAAAFGDQARFVFKPLALPGWDHSVPQVAALMAAADAGKFFEMLDHQFALQRRGGLSEAQLALIAEEIGLDASALVESLRANQYAGRINSLRQQARAAGLTGVPAVLIDGRFVDGDSRTEACLGRLILERAR